MQSLQADPASPAATDEDLMRALCAAEDRSAADEIFAEVFARYRGKVISWCYRIAKDRELSSDLAQEVFLKAYRHRYSFRGDARLSTWLYAIARNHCLTALRSAGSEAGRLDIRECSLEDRGAIRPDRAAEHKDLAARLVRLMLRVLEPLEVRVMALHYAHDIPLAAITRDLGLSNPSGAKAYIVNARRKLLGNLARRGTAACLGSEARGREPGYPKEYAEFWRENAAA